MLDNQIRFVGLQLSGRLATMVQTMRASPATRASLLLRIRDPKDRIAWGEFVRLYAPLLHGYGLHRGLQDADAADLAQEVLRRLMGAVPQFQYDPSRGTFRGWLFTITRNELLKMAKRDGRQAAGAGDSQVRQVLEQQPDAADDEEYWDREYQWNLFHWAARRVQPEFREATWQAFWLTVVEGKEVEAVAGQLAISAGAVYIAKSRITARIRQEIAAVEGE